MKPILVPTMLAALTAMTGCIRPVERFISKEKRTSRVLEYRHEIADDDSTEEVWITAAGGTRKVYGPKQVGYANLARVFWSPNTVYVLRCSAGRTPLALGWVTQSFTPIENDLASSRVLSFLNQQEPVTSLDRFCGKTKFPRENDGPGRERL